MTAFATQPHAGRPESRAGARAQTRPSFTLDQITAYPFPAELTASARGTRIAFTLNERGSRNLWVAEGASFAPRKLITWDGDDGQEIVNVSLSADGQWVAFARGADHGSNFADAYACHTQSTPACSAGLGELSGQRYATRVA